MFAIRLNWNMLHKYVVVVIYLIQIDQKNTVNCNGVAYISLTLRKPFILKKDWTH